MPISISMIVVSSQLVVAVADRVLVSNDGRFCNMNCSSDGRCNVTEGVSPNNVRYATSKRPIPKRSVMLRHVVFWHL
jgi:hypothetical protein